MQTAGDIGRRKCNAKSAFRQRLPIGLEDRFEEALCDPPIVMGSFDRGRIVACNWEIT